MYQYDVETFMCACDRKGLAAKTMKSYVQTLRLFGLFLAERGITQTEEIRHPHIEAYIDKRIKARDLADGGYIIINEENLVSPKERDHLVGLVHGLEGGEILELMGDTDELTYGIDAIEYRKFKNEAPRNEMKITA